MGSPKLSFQQSVLVIEDQNKFEELIKNGLFAYSGNIEFCPNELDAAVKHLERETPDLIVSTLEFKKGSILELIKSADQFFKEVPSLYLTDPHLSALQAEVAKLGAFSFVNRVDVGAGPALTDAIREKIAQKSSTGNPLPKFNWTGSKNTSSDADWAEQVLKKQKP